VTGPVGRFPLLASLLVLAGATVLLLVGPGTAAAAEVGPAEREAIERIIREYLEKHPEVVGEALRALEERRRAAQRERARQAIVAREAELVRDPEAPIGGNPQGDVTVVEFFDYRCTHCQRAVGEVKKLLESDPRVRLVYKEFPILGPESLVAARAALAARREARYPAFHEALMAAAGPLTRPEVLKIATEVGLDAARIQAGMDGAEVTEILRRNYALAQSLGINGTPAFVIGAELVPGAVAVEVLQDLVGRARAR
jgi:protein-disulfide isomerase